MLTLDQLDGMTTAELRAAWEEDIGRPPPTRASDDYMRSVLAYRIQEKAGPRLSNATKRELQRIVRAVEADADYTTAPARQMKEGVKLLREWNGITHEVMALENGFEYRGERFKSLSAVAMKITGAHWSGPRFFGLKSREVAHGG